MLRTQQSNHSTAAPQCPSYKVSCNSNNVGNRWNPYMERSRVMSSPLKITNDERPATEMLTKQFNTKKIYEHEVHALVTASRLRRLAASYEFVKPVREINTPIDQRSFSNQLLLVVEHR